MAKSNKKKSARRLFWMCFILLLIFILAASYWYFIIRPRLEEQAKTEGEGETVVSGGLSFHFLELGNKYAGDCVYVRIGSVDILIDGGSRENSSDIIESYVNKYCEDGILEYVIVTHADQDHIAAFAGNSSYKSLFERFECKTIIDFPRTDKTTQVYKRYVASRDSEVESGAVHYTALECYTQTRGAQRKYELAEGVSMNFLYNYYYDHPSKDENNYSVCLYFQQGESNFLFTGDLEEEGESYLVEMNDLPRCKLFKAGHHGSRTSSTEKLLSIIRPQIVCICCCAGSPEYTSNPDRVFPTSDALARIEKYTRQIYVTSLAVNVDLEKKTWEEAPLNGNIVVESDGREISVTGSNHSLPLCETDWYRENRMG